MVIMCGPLVSRLVAAWWRVPSQGGACRGRQASGLARLEGSVPAVSGGAGLFSEMGFVDAEIAVHALESITGPYTIASVSEAIKAVRDYNTGLLCQGFTYGTYSEHIPNNMDYTVTPGNGKLVLAQGCTLISPADPQVAAYRTLAGTASKVS
jgi:hypothetical protein